MKYPQLVSSSTPASLQDWLEEELESRGIDGVYTRYILSLLQQDSIDLDPSECQHLSSNARHLHQLNRKDVERSKHRRGKSWERHLKGDLCNCTDTLPVDTEKKKKTVAVECLKSASEQKIGIEKLIDEVCTKLKHAQASNAKETLQLINSSPEICLQHSEILESSFQEQAEKYYAAFPALSGKHEPLAELYHQQEMWTVWDGRKLVSFTSEEEVSAQNNPETSSDTESDISEKENKNLSHAKKDVMQCTITVQTPKIQDLQVNAKNPPPSFIVPKMKIPIHKVANLSMYSPFTSSAYQVSKTISTDCKTEYLAERKLFGKDKQSGREGVSKQQFSVAALPRKLIMETDTWELLASLRASTPSGRCVEDGEYQESLVSDLANKFDSNLASIWTKTDVEENVEEPVITEELELSLRILSIKTPPIDNRDLGNLWENDMASVWAVSLEDFKNMKLQERLGSTFQLTSVISIPNLLQNLASHGTSSLSSRNQSPFLGSSNNDESEGIHVRLSTPKNGEFDDMEGILFACPDTLFSASSIGEKSPCSSEYGSISPSELTVGDAQRMYHLWDENKKQDGHNIWANTTNNADKVMSWISSQSKEVPSPSSSSLNMIDGWKMPFPTSCSPSRENCTITYHKGESRFVEVVPSSKSLHFSKVSSVDDCSASNTLKVEEDENLLTSPKTHFQPIHQDLSEGESSTDDVEVPCEDITGTPTPENSLTPGILSPPPGFKRSMSSSLDELVGLAELSGLFNKDVGPGRDTEIFEMITSGWKPELLKDKSTSTESPCLPILNNMPTFRDNKIWSSGSVEDTLSEISLPWKWSTTDDANDLWMIPHLGEDEELEDDIFEETDIGYCADGILRDYNLKALRKELEEEEEELFRDINCLSDGSHANTKALCSESNATYNEEQGQDAAFSEKKLSSCFEANDWEASGQALKSGDSISEVDSKHCRESDDSNSTFPMVPVDKVLYSSQLEDEWRKASEPFDVQVPKKTKNKSKAVSQRRPCTFYLEGNCRRSDCKFSHDLASITCRFWEEGTCFKGITCPFLHGYISDIHPCGEDAQSHKFVLESESDFPSLSKCGNAVNNSVKAPSKNTGRIIRPKKKKQSTLDPHKRLEIPQPTTL